MRWRDLTWGEIGRIALGMLQWSIAILSVIGTLALIGWMVMLMVRKDKRNDGA